MADSDKTNANKVQEFSKGLKAEFRKIVWPTQETLTKQTVAVVSISVVLGLLISVLDWVFQNTDYPALYSYCKYTNEPSIRTAESIGMHSDCDYPDEANGITHVSVISKEDWLSEIGAEVINQQKEGLQDGV